MANIVPAILTDQKDIFKYRFSLIKDYANTIQIDVMDGEYVPSKSFRIEEISEILNEIKFDNPIELHLMVKEPLEYIEEIMNVKNIDAAVIHFDACRDIGSTIDEFKKNSINVGVCFKLGTKIEFMNLNFDYFLVLSIAKAGYLGKPFDKRGLDQIESLKKVYNLDVEVDGGMNVDTGKECLSKGADRLIVDSAIFKNDDPLGYLKQLQEI